jgi:hypothetical protein
MICQAFKADINVVVNGLRQFVCSQQSCIQYSRWQGKNLYWEPQIQAGKRLTVDENSAALAVYEREII